MAYGKTIELYLVSGKPEGIVTAELSNWNGKAIKLPREDVMTTQREDVQLPGVYFLFCSSEDEGDAVYIGEAENVVKRLRTHINDYKAGKESYFWQNAVMFVSTALNKALIRHLERCFYLVAKECNQYQVLTNNTYGNTVLKESQIASMEEFQDNVKVLISAMGYRIFTPEAKPKPEGEEIQYFYCKGAKEGRGCGYMSDQGFVVTKGSVIASNIQPSFEKHNYLKLRQRLLEKEGLLKNFAFQTDYTFNSPSAAAAVILGRSANGVTEWKSKEGVTMKAIVAQSQKDEV